MATSIAVLIFTVPALCNKWIIPGCILLVLYLYKHAIIIFRKYNYKKEIYSKLIQKASKRYEQRYFIPYMGSPCMRSVVYFALCEINHQKDYKNIKKRAFADCRNYEKPHIAIINTDKNGKLSFFTIDPITGDKEEV